MANFLTQDDVSNYGSDLVDFAQRAAANALTPAIAQVQNDNAQLHRRLAIEARHRLDQQVEQAIPGFREIDRRPDWHAWLRGVDALNGRVRQQLLNDAIADADAGRVVSIFRAFIRDASQPDRAGPASGRSRPASRAPVAGARVYTRPEIGQLYEQHRKGLLTGPEWDAQEADIIAATRENRVNAYPYVGK